MKMHSKIQSIILITCIISISFNQKVLSQDENKSKYTKLKGPYLGQKLPGVKAELFASELISKNNKRHSKISISPDGAEIYWSFFVDNKDKIRKIAFISYNNENWEAERIADFNSQYGSDSPCFFGNDKIVFHAKRNSAVDSINIVEDFWMVEKKNNEWSEPKPLGFNHICEIHNMPMLSIAENGNIYFNGKYKGGKYNLGIYVSYFIDNSYSSPVLLPKEINSKYLDWIPFIAPDESYLIFASGRGKKKGGTSDLYISYKGENGNWLSPLNMGDNINSESEERFPSVSPDGNVLFFMRGVNLDAKYYWVDAQVIEELKPEHLK